MYRITVTYGTPSDPVAFAQHYAEVHVPLVNALPNLKGFTTVEGEGLDGAAGDWFFQACLYFDTKEEALTALSSEAGQATEADVANLASGGVTIVGGYETNAMLAQEATR